MCYGLFEHTQELSRTQVIITKQCNYMYGYLVLVGYCMLAMNPLWKQVLTYALTPGPSVVSCLRVQCEHDISSIFPNWWCDHKAALWDVKF